MEFKEEIKIDIYNLEEEWEKQPQLYLKWAEAYSKAIEKRDLMELRLKVVEAKLFQDIKTNYEEYGLDKSPTDTVTKQLVVLQPEYRKAYRELVKAKKEANILDSAKKAFEHRKKALENITLLWLAGYYSEPYVPKNAKEESKEKKRELLKEKLNQVMRRRNGMD